MPASTSAEATSVRLENGSDSRSVPRDGNDGFTYEYSEDGGHGELFQGDT